MSNLFVKVWRYMTAWGGQKFEENADPKVQLQQAIEETQKRSAKLREQAAAVIGNQRQLEMKLNRALSEAENYEENARRALTLAEEATATGDTAKAHDYTQTAESFAAQLTTTETEIESLKKLHEQAVQASQQAQSAVQQNALQIQNQLNERTKLLSQLEQAKMQEEVSASLEQVSSLSLESGPSLNSVRDKIEARYAKALGSSELHKNSIDGKMAEIQQDTHRIQAQSRLEKLRLEMKTNKELPQS